MEKILLVMLLWWQLPITLFAQQLTADNREIARIGNVSISAEEFRNRFELMFPYKPTDLRTLDSVKSIFLYSLVAEKLWALEGSAAGADTLTGVRKLLQQLEKIYALDAFYRDSIESKVLISPAQIQQGVNRLPKTLFIQMIKSTDHTVIQKAFSDLHRGITFDSIMFKMHGFTTAFPVVFGQFSDALVEDAVYLLQPGTHTGILTADGQYVIIKLIKTDFNELESKDLQTLQKEAEFQLRRREGLRLQKQMIERYFGSERVEVAGESYRSVAKLFFTTLKSRYLQDTSSAQISLKFSDSEMRQIKQSLGEELLNKPFILFQEQPVTLEDFLDYVPFLDVKLKKLRAASFDAVLRSEIQKYIEREHLSRIAGKFGYRSKAVVLKRMQTWRESLVAEKGRELFASELFKKQMQKHSVTTGSAKECRPAVAFTAVYANNIFTIDSVLSHLQWGTQFHELSRYLTGLSNAPLQVTLLDSMNIDAVQRKQVVPGQVIGPILRDGYYTLYKVVDTLTQCTTATPYQSAIAVESIAHAMDAQTASLSVKYHAQFNADILKSIPVTGINMITVEQLGFGLKLPAFPFIPEDSSWMYQLPSMQAP